MIAKIFALPLLCTAFGTCLIQAGDLSNYRGIAFGSNIASAAKQARTDPSEVKNIYKRPALIQEMDWRPRSATMTDPVDAGVLTFFNGELFRITITYNRFRIEGMTTHDMAEAISATYGPATTPREDVVFHSIYGETAAVVARWEDADYSFNLVRTGDQASYALVMYSKRLNEKATAAITEAIRMETEDAPRRELEKQKQLDDDRRLSLEKARQANLPNFKP